MKRRTFISLMSVMAAAGVLSLAGCSSNTSASTASSTAASASAAAANKLETIQSNGKLVIALEGAWQPWSFHDESDTLVGYDVEVSRAIAEKLGVEPEYVESDWDSLFAGLDAGRYDLVCNGVEVTEERAKTYDFTTPYGYIHTALAVRKDNDDIKSVDDLADKNVAVQSGSNGPAILEEFAPKASQQEFKTDEEARQALQQGRVDAYVIDNNMQQSALVREPGKYKIAGKPFGNKEPYGIGLPLDSDGVAFVNDFLKKIEDDGTWTELWQICIGDRTGDTNVPELPEVGA